MTISFTFARMIKLSDKLFQGFIPGLALLLLLQAMMFSSCRKEEDFDTSPSLKLSFSEDSVLFDTVFSTLGSATRILMVYNSSKKPVLISAAGLEKGPESQFRLNVDGISSHLANDIEIGAEDSIYVFVKVRVDPTSQNSPLVVTDRLFFETNGNLQTVDLVAWGQDAHYIVANKFVEGLPPYRIVASGNQTVTWSNDKPFLIYGYAVVDSLGVLNIEKGCRIHFHNNSGLWVYRFGSLRVNGTLDERVVFQGDRLEESYQDVSGQWDRIWLNEGSVDNVINYAVIKNGFIGLQLETLLSSEGNKLMLSNTVIHNMSGWGIFTRFYRLEAWNCEISGCGLDNVYLSTGGDYDFRHCTMGNYWSGTVRKTPAVLISNFYKNEYTQTLYTGDLKRAFFGNCIIYGNLEDEFITAKEEGVMFNYRLDHCLVKTAHVSDSLVSCIRNQDPLFLDIEKHDYTLKESSPARGAGSVEIATPFPNDLPGNPRLPSPDLGAYQFMPR